MNNDRRFREGERVRLQVDAAVDGYLLVLNYDTDGRLRVLFPIDPRDDGLVRAGRRYEVRDASGESAFRAGPDGTGMIYTAISREPWRLEEFVSADRWDYSRLSVDRDVDNPEAAITDLVQQLSGPGGFDYDIAGYRVYGTTRGYGYGDSYNRTVYVYDDYLFCNDWYWRYNGCHRWPGDYGLSIGFGYYPYSYYPYGYYPYGHGYRPYGFNPYSPYLPYRPVNPGGRRPVIVGRPRNYTVFPRPAGGTAIGGGTRPLHGDGGRIGSRPAPTALPPVNWRPRSVARPVVSGSERPEVTRGPGESRVYIPPARRARPEALSFPTARGNEFSGGGRERSRGDWSPPSRAEPRAYDPPRASHVGGGGGGGGGGDRGGAHAGGSGGGGGGHSAPARSRRP